MLRDGANGLPILKTLRTPRLRLEPLAETHASALFAGLRSNASHEFIGDRPPESVEALAQRFRRLTMRVASDGRESSLNWALWSVSANRHVGVVQATLHPHQSAHVTFVFFHEAWGNACAREGAIALIDHLAEWGFSDVWATVDTCSRRSIALLEGLGFLRIAVRKNAAGTCGTPSDQFVYCLTLEWPSFTFLT